MTTIEETKRLLEIANSELEDWENAFNGIPNSDGELKTIEDLLNDNLGISISVWIDGGYRGCRVCTQYGGPAVYINTVTNLIEVNDWTDHVDIGIESEITERIDNIVFSWCNGVKITE